MFNVKKRINIDKNMCKCNDKYNDNDADRGPFTRLKHSNSPRATHFVNWSTLDFDMLYARIPGNCGPKPSKEKSNNNKNHTKNMKLMTSVLSLICLKIKFLLHQLCQHTKQQFMTCLAVSADLIKLSFYYLRTLSSKALCIFVHCQQHIATLSISRNTYSL